MVTGWVSFTIRSFTMEAVDNTFSVQFSFYETCKSTYYLDVQSGVTSKHALLRKSIVKGAQLRYFDLFWPRTKLHLN